MKGLLEGKRALILGVANDMSIAYGITKIFKEHGASIGLTYLNENLKKRVAPIAEEVGADFLVEMDVTQDAHYAQLKQTVESHWGNFDILVHSLAFADKDDLKNPFTETSREGFKMACDISAFSLIGLCNTLAPMMNKGGSIMSMTYHGSVKVLKGYNVMGVAKAALEASNRYLADDLGQRMGLKVNCISAGPIRTLAASGVPGLKDYLKTIEEKAPLRQNISKEDVAGTALYLASSLSNGVTGQVLYVDAGMSIIS